MAYTFIKRDEYFNLKEYPKPDNIVNRIKGELATPSEAAEETIGYSNPGPQQGVNYDLKAVYPMTPLSTSVKIDLSMKLSEASKARYSNIIRAEIRFLRMRLVSKFDAGSQSQHDASKMLFEVYRNSTGEWGKTYGYKEEDYMPSKYYEQFNFHADTSVLNEISLHTQLGINDKVVKTEEMPFDAKDIREYTRPGYMRHQEWADAPIIRFYSYAYTINYDKKFLFSSDGPMFNIHQYDIGRNPLIQTSAKYDGTPIEKHLSDVIFSKYKNGRPTAELDWIGDPTIKVGDFVKIEPLGKYGDESALSEYVVTGIKHSFDGGYSQKLYLIER